MRKLLAGSVCLDLPVLVSALLGLPTAYFIVSYTYLISWHRKSFLWDTLIHENGRLTLLGSMFYFDHFLATVPMVILFALSAAGGFAVGASVTPSGNHARARFVAILLFYASLLFVLLAFIASVSTVGWQRTLDYAFQRIERDGIISNGGNWNQLQLSNIPIALGTIGLSSAFVSSAGTNRSQTDLGMRVGGLICIAAAAAISLGITAANWSGWQAFVNPRWLAHSLREAATYPLTGIPIALTSVILVERYISGITRYRLNPGLLSWLLIGAGLAIITGELLILTFHNIDVLSIAQKPAFAPDGLSIPYLLSSHVFEHFLDFVLIGPLAGSAYALVRSLSR